MPSSSSRVSIRGSARPVSGWATVTSRGSEPATPANARADCGWRASHAASASQAREQRVQRGLVVGGRRLPAAPCRPAPRHRAPRGALPRKLAHVLQRRARAVRRADQVDARRAQRLRTASRSAIAIAWCSGAGRRAARPQPCAGSCQSRASAAAASSCSRSGAQRLVLVAQHSGALRPVPRWSTNTRSRRLSKRASCAATRPGQLDRALPRAAGEEEHRVGQLVARQRRQHREVHIDLRAVGPRRIERPRTLAAQRLVRHALQPARRQPARSGLRPEHLKRPTLPARSRAQTCRARHSSAAPQGLAPRTAQASKRCNSPLAISLARSSAPPTSVPLTKTIGKVGQPVHIFNALRRRQSLR